MARKIGSSGMMMITADRMPSSSVTSTAASPSSPSGSPISAYSTSRQVRAAKSSRSARLTIMACPSPDPDPDPRPRCSVPYPGSHVPPLDRPERQRHQSDRPQRDDPEPGPLVIRRSGLLGPVHDQLPG